MLFSLLVIHRMVSAVGRNNSCCLGSCLRQPQKASLMFWNGLIARSTGRLKSWRDSMSRVIRVSSNPAKQSLLIVVCFTDTHDYICARSSYCYLFLLDMFLFSFVVLIYDLFLQFTGGLMQRMCSVEVKITPRLVKHFKKHQHSNKFYIENFCCMAIWTIHQH